MTSFTTDYNNNNTISQINIEEDDDDEEMQLDEMEALNSIFGHNFKILKHTVPRMIEIDNIENHIKLIASLPSTYPSIQPPKCTLSIISNDIIINTKKTLKQFISSFMFPPFTKGGMGCIFDYVQHVVDNFPTSVLHHAVGKCPHEDKQLISDYRYHHHDQVVDENQYEKVILFLEHMNDSISYRKILKRWSSNYTLFLEIWYRLPKKVISANINNSKKKKNNIFIKNKKMRVEDVYVLLEGEKSNITKFLQKLKIEYIDVNKQGVKCKERKSTVLMRIPVNSNKKCMTSSTKIVEIEYVNKNVNKLNERLADFGYSDNNKNTDIVVSSSLLSKIETVDMKNDEKNTTKNNTMMNRVILIKFDHIKSKQVRKGIKSIALSLNLGGIMRPGKPGLVCIEGNNNVVSIFEKQIRSQFSTCTRNGGCWGPANHHFQSISVIGEKDVDDFSQCHFNTIFEEFETETIMHAAHLFANVGLKDFFFSSSGLNIEWEIPQTVGNPDPYLKPRGGTRRKCSNKRI